MSTSIADLIEIYPNDLNNGIIQADFSDAIIHDINKNILYSFDLSAMKKIITSRIQPNNYCNKSLQRILDIEIKTNLNWTKYKPEPIFDTKFTKRINQTFDFNRALATYLDFPIISKTECNYLEQLIREFKFINYQLNKLAKSNLTTIDAIISRQSIILDIYDNIDEGHTLPFVLSEYNLDTFFKTSNFGFYQNNYTVTLSFEIQLYSKSTMNIINFKPILRKNLPYILNSNITYMTKINEEYIFYSKTAFNTLCDLRQSTFHCIRPIKNWECEEKMIKMEKVPKSCLQKLKRKNIFTRVDKNIYLLLFETVVFRITCGNHTPYFIKLSNHSTIDNEHDCIIDNSYYAYNPSNTSNRYELIETDFPHIFDPDFMQTETINLWDFYLTIFYLLSLASAYVLFTIITIMCTNKVIIIDSKCETQSVRSHVYTEPEDYYCTIP